MSETLSISHGIEEEPGRREVRERRTHECNVVRALNANHSVQVVDVAHRIEELAAPLLGDHLRGRLEALLICDRC